MSISLPSSEPAKQVESDELNRALDTAVQQTLVHSNLDGKVVIQHEQDVSTILDVNKRQRDEATTLGMGRFKEKRKGGMNFHQAMRVPFTVALEIKAKYGLDMFGRTTQDEKKRIYKIIQTEYPYCMTIPGRIF